MRRLDLTIMALIGGTIKHGKFKEYKFGFVDEMRIHCGHIMTIRAVYEDDLPADQVDYRLVEDEGNYMWSLSMFDPIPVDEDFIDMVFFLIEV